MAFFVMGSSYWGRCFLVGLAFFALAAVMPFMLGLAPLALGVMWSGTLLLISWHVRQVGKSSSKEAE